MDIKILKAKLSLVIDLYIKLNVDEENDKEFIIKLKELTKIGLIKIQTERLIKQLEDLE